MRISGVRRLASRVRSARSPQVEGDGSLVVDVGGAYRAGVPVRSLHQFRFVVKVVDELGYHLAEEFYWYNPSKLPGPIEWVNKRKIRAKDSVNTVWWFAKTEWPKADVTQVRVPYSDRMKKLLEDPGRFYAAGERPSQHSISGRFGTDNGGAIPSNLLPIANTDSNSYYIRTARRLGITSHPARFPEALPQFFIRMLTSEDDLVLDIFSGSNTTARSRSARGGDGSRSKPTASTQRSASCGSSMALRAPDRPTLRRSTRRRSSALSTCATGPSPGARRLLWGAAQLNQRAAAGCRSKYRSPHVRHLATPASMRSKVLSTSTSPNTTTTLQPTTTIIWTVSGFWSAVRSPQFKASAGRSGRQGVYARWQPDPDGCVTAGSSTAASVCLSAVVCASTIGAGRPTSIAASEQPERMSWSLSASAVSTDSDQRVLTCTQAAAYQHRWPASGGSHAAGSWSPFERAETAMSECS